MIRLSSLLIFGLLVNLGGCKDKQTNEGSKTNQDEAVPKERAPQQTPPKEPGPAIAVDEKLMEGMKTLATTCKLHELDGHMAGALSCKNKEDWAFRDKFFVAATAAKPTQSIATVAVALASTDPSLQQVAASVLLQQFSFSGWGSPQIGDVSKQVAGLLRKTVPNLPWSLKSKSIRAAVHATILSGDEAELAAFIEGLAKGGNSTEKDKRRSLQIQGRAWAATARFLGLKHQDKFFAGVNGDDPLGWDMAVRAMNGLSMDEAEQKVVCPLAMKLMKTAYDANKPQIRRDAAGILAKCGTEAIDSILDLSQEIIEAGKFDYALADTHLSLCDLSMDFLDKKTVASEQQCAQSDKLLETVIADPKVPAADRARALHGRTEYRIDKKTSALLEKHAAGKIPELAAEAKKQLESLQEKLESTNE